MTLKKNKFNIGLVGLGTVGGGVYRLLKNKAALLSRRSGVSLELVAVFNRTLRRMDEHRVPKRLRAVSIDAIVKNPAIDCVIELIGSKREAKHLILEALRNGKDVVTANKALLAEEGDVLFKAARQHGRQIYFEASVGGGIPIIKALRESLVGNRITSILSIINGTANYILSKMTREGMDLKTALSLAQEKGYAEADPTFDIDGVDAAHKITILSRLAFERNVAFTEVDHHGISRIEPLDIEFAKEVDYVLKLLAVAKQTKEGIEVRVQPTLLPKDHLLANIHGSYNAVHLYGDEIGNMLFVGRGAGSRPTASAVVADIVDLARVRSGKASALPYPVYAPVRVKKLGKIHSRYYLRFSVIDKPGVVSRITQILGRRKISISDVVQRERKEGGVVPLILLTHEAHEEAIMKAVNEINRLGIVRRKSQVLRIEE